MDADSRVNRPRVYLHPGGQPTHCGDLALPAAAAASTGDHLGDPPEGAGALAASGDAVIARLRDAGILTKASGRQRYVAWVAPQVTSALDAFAARARRG